MTACSLLHLLMIAYLTALGHFEPTNNCQLYIVLHSRTIYYQEIQYCSDQNFDLLFAPTEFAFNAWFGSLDRD